MHHVFVLMRPVQPLAVNVGLFAFVAWVASQGTPPTQAFLPLTSNQVLTRHPLPQVVASALPDFTTTAPPELHPRIVCVVLPVAASQTSTRFPVYAEVGQRKE